MDDRFDLTSITETMWPSVCDKNLTRQVYIEPTNHPPYCDLALPPPYHSPLHNSPMALTSRPIMLSPTQPPYFDIPSFKYRPEFGSHGTGPLVSSVGSVSATSQQGGYREVGDRGWDLNEVQCHNTLRLMTFVWGSNDAKAFGSIAGGLISREHASSLSKLLRARFGTRSTHPIYLMVQENVQCYDLGANIRDLARTAVLHMLLASPDESQAAINRRKTIAADYQTASYELRDRAIARIDENIDELATSCAGIAGLVQITRLESLRARLK